MIIIVILLVFTVGALSAQPARKVPAETLIVRAGFAAERISKEWSNAIESRMSRHTLDSMLALTRPMSKEELEWKALIESKAARWNLFRDSLAVPFQQANLDDTVYVIVGYLGVDDGFTYQYQTVCLDVTALNREYGSASLSGNDGRIDRIFAHEFTHLLHKDWARKTGFELRSFRDSILWECLYEGIGMYRSLSSKWLPVEGVLPEMSRTTLEELYPVFVDRITRLESAVPLTDEGKIQWNKNLSRGPVNKKWGALSVGLWLALEAKGSDRSLIPWIDGGPESVIRLAKKYLTGANRKKFLETFPN